MRLRRHRWQDDTQMDWTGYEVFDPEVDRPLDEVPRADAQRHFDKLMAERPQRTAMLDALLHRSAGLSLGEDDASIAALEQWYRGHVEPDPKRPQRLFPEWYSVANDIGVHLGDVSIARSPQLSWCLFVWGKKNVSYQRPVLMGFRDAPARWNHDPDAWVVGVGLRALQGRRDEEEFVPVMHMIAAQADGRFE